MTTRLRERNDWRWGSTGTRLDLYRNDCVMVAMCARNAGFPERWRAYRPDGRAILDADGKHICGSKAEVQRAVEAWADTPGTW